MWDFLLKGAVFYKDIAMSKITLEILPEILYYGKAFDVEAYGQVTFIEGYHTALKFPPEATDITARQAQRMNYEYCVQTMAGLIKKYAPEILK